MTDIFTLWKNPYNIRNICLFRSENSRSVCFGVDAIVLRASQSWQKVSISIKHSSSLEIFKAKIKLWSCDNCLCNLCKYIITNVSIYNLYDCIFSFFNFSRCLLVSKLLWFLSTLNKEMYVCMCKNTIRIKNILHQFVIAGQYFGRMKQNLSCQKLGYILSTFQRPRQEGIVWKESPRRTPWMFFPLYTRVALPIYFLLQALSWWRYGTSMVEEDLLSKSASVTIKQTSHPV